MSNHYICAGTTQKGIGCTKRVPEDGAYCHIHAAYQDVVVTVPPTQDAAPIINPIPTNTEESPMNDASIPTMAESLVSGESPIPTLAESAPIVNQDGPAATTSYLESTTPINVVIPRKDAVNPLISYYKPNQKDQDIRYFDHILSKKRDIRKLVMSEYFTCPDYWVPTVKLKGGETPAERLIRDWEGWRTAYARAFRAGKVRKIDGVFFHPAKINAPAYIALMRAGKRAYCLEYAKAMGNDEQSFLSQVAIADAYPLVQKAIVAATALNAARKRKTFDQDAIDSARDAWRMAFDAACVALRAIDTSAVDADATQTAGAIVDGVTA